MLTHVLVLALLSGGSAPGTLGALPPHDSVLLDQELTDPPRIVAVDAQHRAACPHPGAVCSFPGGGSTVYVAEFYDRVGEPVIGLTRAPPVASRKGVATTAQHDPWRIDVVANLRDKVRGAVLVAIFDRSEPESIARREAKLVWDLDVATGRWLGLKTTLDPGTFRAGHAYLIRFTQVNGPHERILAEGDLRLD